MIAFDAHHEKLSVSTQAGGTVFGFRLVHASAQPLVAVFVDAWCESETWLQRCECLASASAWCAHSMPTLTSPGLLEQPRMLSVWSESTSKVWLVPLSASSSALPHDNLLDC